MGFCLTDFTVAYVTKINIVIAKYLSGYSVYLTPQISIIHNAHGVQITFVAFSKSK